MKNNILIWLDSEGNVVKIKDDSIDIATDGDVGEFCVIDDADNDDWE